MAFGNATFSDASSAVSDLFAYQASGYKAQGHLLEAQNYDAAAAFADQNEKFTEASTAIKEHQAQRQIYQVIGTQTTDIAGAGFSTGSGTALDLLRSSASEGAITHAALGQQGLITEQGYRVQADAYRNMAEAARVAAEADQTSGIGALIGTGLKIASAVASVYTGNPAALWDVSNSFLQNQPTDI